MTSRTTRRRFIRSASSLLVPAWIASKAHAGLMLQKGAQAVSASSGGTSALSWDAAYIAENVQITFSTDGTHDFGATGPTVKLYMDGRSRTNGTAAYTTDPEIGMWNSLDATTWVTSDHPSSSCSISAIDATGTHPMVFGVPDTAGYHGLEEFQEIFMAWSTRDLLNVFPSRASDNRRNVKEVWMMLGHRGDNTAYSASQGIPNAGHDLYIPGISGTGLTGVIAGNETATSFSGNLAGSWNYNGWNRNHFAARLNPANPYGSPLVALYQQCSTVGWHERVPSSGGIMSNQTSEGVTTAAWDRAKFAAYYYRQTSDRRALDDIYIATGAGAIARIMLADSGVKTSIRKTAFVLPHPSAWSTSSITGTIKLGTLNPSVDQIWAYIYDQDNNQIGPVQLM